jgi:hypothetical protein
MAKKKTKAEAKVSKVMREFKAGTLNSGTKKGPKVKSRKQAIAIALSEAAKVSKKRKKR